MIRKRLKIALVCDPITDFIAGGTVSTLRFAEVLRERGHHIVFLAAKSPDRSYETSYNGFPIYRFRSLPLPKNEGQFRMSFPTPKQIEAILIKEAIDILHFMLPHPAAIASLKAARRLRVRVVAHSHTQPENIVFHLPAIRSFLNTLISRYLIWLYNKADALVYPSELARRLLDDKLGDTLLRVVISNGVDTKKFRPLEVPNHSTEAVSIHFTLLFVGRLHPEKAIDTLIKALPVVLRHHPDVRVSIVGSGHLDRSLRSLSRRLGLEARVIFAGNVSEERLIRTYNSCDIFVLPSWAELEGMAVLEAMACGKPIVVADSPYSASTHFVDGNGLLFRPGDPEDLARQVTALLSDDAARAAMGRVSRIRSESHDIHSSVDKLEELYWSLLSREITGEPASNTRSLADR
jgi:glycosyltransferase involved in cell wall biosynthesis